MTTKPVPWLNAKRLRAHGILLGVALWSIYIWTLSTPTLRDRNGNLKGTDFLHFYTLGTLALEHRSPDLYDMNAQTRLAAQRVPDAAGIRYLPLYPPQVSILFAPLARLSYGRSLALWWTLTAVLYGVCCYAVWRSCSNLRTHGVTVAVLAAAFPAFFHLIAWGQTSALALACFTLMLFLLRNGKAFFAGLALGCLVFKPQLGLAAAVVFVAIGSWKILAGAIVSGLAEFSVGAVYYGTDSLREWLRTMGNVGSLLPLLEPRPYQTHSLRTFWSMLVRYPHVAFVFYVLSAGAILALTIQVWKHSQHFALRYSALLFATVLVSPHLTVYDLVILAPAFLLLADWLIGREPQEQRCPMGITLYAVFLLPLLGPYSQWIRLQPSVIAMTLVVLMTWCATRSEQNRHLASRSEQEA